MRLFDRKRIERPGGKTFQEVIHERRSIRHFLDMGLQEETVMRIFDAANAAPSAGNLQAYEIVVVTDAYTKARLREASLNQKFVEEAPVDLVFFANLMRSALKYRERGTGLYCVQDATIAATYAMLAATDAGLGSVWVGAFNEIEVSRILQAHAHQRPVAILCIGYIGKEPGPTRRRELTDLVHNEKIEHP
ncbi:nitroreductase family protein [Candidatus Micrarchaeota archaeon]|nr:nitroreductase family protein [Candidatus Micrarchaeota archaeon]